MLRSEWVLISKKIYFSVPSTRRSAAGGEGGLKYYLTVCQINDFELILSINLKRSFLLGLPSFNSACAAGMENPPKTCQSVASTAILRL